MKRPAIASSLLWPVSLLVLLTAAGLYGRQSSVPEPKNWTTAEDHQDMMNQLGIKKLRPGPSGDEKAPNAANYDEALANPFPKLPEVLTLKNGKKVTSAKDVVEQTPA